MHVLITGGTGFIGKALCYQLKTGGHSLCVLTRNVQHARQCLPMEGVQFIQNLSEIKSNDHFDAVINLAGAPIFRRWTKRAQQIIQSSRVELTEQLVAKLKQLAVTPTVLISGSAIGFYGNQGDNELSETSVPYNGFSHDVCQAWEVAALQAKDSGIRVCTIRTGITLGPNGGALARMRIPFLLGMGGPIGRGTQWMSWIHLDDLIRIILYCIENQQIQGPVNATSPLPVRNKTFAQIYAKSLHRPALFTLPGTLLELIYGQMAKELLLNGQRVIPKKLNQSGFTFLYPDLSQALSHL